jgi:hypothetical protein
MLNWSRSGSVDTTDVYTTSHYFPPVVRGLRNRKDGDPSHVWRYAVTIDTSGTTRPTTQGHIPKILMKLQYHRCENLKSDNRYT